MSIPKVVGLEQEYAIALSGSRDYDPVELSFLVVNSHEKATRAIWDYDRESPLLDARGFRREGEEAVISTRANYRINNLLMNGARFYVDHAHPEYSTPECLRARDAVAVDRAGEIIVRMAAARANDTRPPDSQILLFKNNSDHKGNSYGTHENYLMATEAYLRLFPRYPAYPDLSMRWLVPYLITRQVFCGAGKVGSENGTDACDYQISQRADFFETIVGGQTTHTRPLVNSRDEPHADKERFSRLHVILGDANMSEVSAWLKVGVTQMVLELIEDQQLDFDLTLADPVRAVVEVSHDPSLKRRIKLKAGPAMTAVEIQRRFLEAAADRFRDHADPERRALFGRWARVLDALEGDPMSLSQEVDWVIKKRLIDRLRARKGLSYTDARVVQMDFQYHDIRPDRGLYGLLEREGQVERLLSDAEIKTFVMEAPPDTRAYFRSQCLKRYRDHITHANWDVLTFDVGDNRERKISMMDPLKGTREHVQELLDRSPDVRALLEQVGDART